MTEASADFGNLCSAAVTAFLQTVVVIDNEASLVSGGASGEVAPSVAVRRRASAPGGPGGEAASSINKDAEAICSDRTSQSEESDAHRLELNAVSQAFAERGLTCGVYLPTETDPAENCNLVAAAVRAILPTDACVLDWQLRKGDCGPAIAAIEAVLNKDGEQGGRLRLILVYTAEELVAASSLLYEKLKSVYQATMSSLNSGPVITGGHFRIVFVNKPTMGRNPDDDLAVVPWTLLPQRIISEFTTLSRGLLRAFALKSVAAVRRDIHRILAQFDEELDPVYAGDRATKPDPDDAGHLVVELLQSELALSIGASGAEGDVLGETGCMAWLGSRGGNVSDIQFKLSWEDGHSANSIDEGVRRRLISSGTKGLKSQPKKFHSSVTRAFFPQNADAEWNRRSSHYAVLTTLAYHAGTQVNRVVSMSPMLGFGTVVGSDDGDWLCIQPACDTVRITDSDKTAFLFIRLIQNDTDFDLIIPKGGEFIRYQAANDGRFKNLRELRTLWFKPVTGHDVIHAQKGDSGGFFFIDEENGRWAWRAQLRDMTAVHIAQRAVRAIGRIGLNEFEWLRTSAK